MYASLLGAFIRRSVRRLNNGDIGPMLAAYADDAVHKFPGKSSWAGTRRGKAEIEKFLQRFVDVSLQLEIRQFVVSGWPWNTSVCVLFTDFAQDDSGNVVYENSGVIYARISWGKITFQENFEDTEKVTAFDAYLAAHEPSAS